MTDAAQTSLTKRVAARSPTVSPSYARRRPGCRACDLWQTGTQTVFGEGRERAEVMMVGEQPGDREDIEGRPFVGPAGRVLDKALERGRASTATASTSRTS